MKNKAAKIFLSIMISSVLITSTSVGVISAGDTNSDGKTKQQLQNEVSDLTSYMTNLQSQINAANEEISSINNKIAELEVQIEKSESDLAVANSSVDGQYDQMKLRIQYMYESPDMDLVGVLLNSENFGEMMNSYEYVKNISSYDREMLDKLEKTVSSVKATNDELLLQKANLENLRAEADEKKNSVLALMDQTKEDIGRFQDQIANFEADALAYERQLEAQKNASQTTNGPGTPTPVENTYVARDNDEKLLATIIYSEAGNQSYYGKLAVGAVVMNRVNSPRFAGNTIYDILNAPNQFSPVDSGRFAYYYATNSATEECYQAAREVLAGNIVGGWFYFMVKNPDRQGEIIGDHVFFYEW